MAQSYITILLGRDVVWHPRGYYRIAQSLAKGYSLRLIGRPMPPIQIEGPLSKEVDPSVLETLLMPPNIPFTTEVTFLRQPWLKTYLEVVLPQRGWVIVTEPLSALLKGLWGRSQWVWDIWEDYGANLRHDPAYRLRSRWGRYLIWHLARKTNPAGYTLAEYCYAELIPLWRARFLPNAFVSVENALPLLPNLVKEYALITGNLTESWGAWDALAEAIEKPTMPLVIAGSIKTPIEERRLGGYLARHKAWLWLRSYFVPYPVVQNLQRYAGLLYGLYQPLPHIRDKIPGKFYEAAVLGVRLRWREGVSPVWDAFWRKYRDNPSDPMLYWTYYEPMLLQWIKELIEGRQD